MTPAFFALMLPLLPAPGCVISAMSTPPPDLRYVRADQPIKCTDGYAAMIADMVLSNVATTAGGVAVAYGASDSAAGRVTMGSLGMAGGFAQLPFIKAEFKRVTECRRLKELERDGHLAAALEKAKATNHAGIGDIILPLEVPAQTVRYRGFVMDKPSPAHCAAACAADPRCKSFQYSAQGLSESSGTGSSARCYLEERRRP